MDTRYGNNYSTGNLKPMDGKMIDFEQCDSGIDSFNPSLQSFDSDVRSNSFQTDLGISGKFSSLSVSTADTTSMDRMDEQKLYDGADERFDSGYISSITSEYSLSIPEPPTAAPVIEKKESGPELDTRNYLPDADGDTCLQLAIIQNNSNAAFDMIQYCTNPNFLNVGNENQQTALHFSVLVDNLSITRCLVAYGANVECPDRNGNTPLHIACERGLIGQIEMLTCKLDKDEDPGMQKHELPQDVDLKNYSGFTPLHLAVLNGQYEAVYVLIHELKCDLNIHDGKSGRTALHHAIEAHNYPMAKLLVQSRADVNVLTYDECSPLHFAVARGLLKEADMLLRNNADLYLITRDDFDVFELSVHSKNSRRMSSYLKDADKKQKKRLSQQFRGIN